MKQLDGGISVDLGRRTRRAGSTSSQPSRAEVRAARSSAGAWDEDLGKWGSDRWVLPGQGERGAGCNEYYPTSICDAEGHMEFGTRVCGKRSCPECWGSWAKTRGVSGTQRIQAFRYTQPDDYRRQVAHATVNPPEGEIMNEREYWEGRQKAAEIAKEKGFRGGAIIPHPFRATDEAINRYRAEDPGYGLWVWLREDVEDMDEYIYWSPHYHIIGPTSADMEPGEDSDEWLYEFHRSFESFDGIHDSESHGDLYGTFRYLLSHTGFPERSRRQVVTWYGCLANSVFVEDATEEWQNEKPSAGVRSALQREIEAVAGPTEDEEDEEGDESVTDDCGKCPVDGCDGLMIGVFDVDAYLRQANPPPEVAERMKVALDWRLGRIEPPPGLRNPQSEEEARESFEVLLQQ